ncbi:hypothetical protein [Agromyces agglutinans]|nr:hypothetical protein [Agromyces agglutinans]
MDQQVVDWLLDSDPAIRWQVRRDLLDEPAARVAAERARVADEGWGRDILALQDANGYWGGDVYGDRRERDTVMWTLHVLLQFGIDPEASAVREAIARVRDHVTWPDGDAGVPFFETRYEECVTGGVLSYAAYFGLLDGAAGGGTDRRVARLLEQRRDDGGWNCDPPEQSPRSSFDSTLCVIEGLRAYQRATASTDAALADAVRTGEEYLLERKLFRRASTGEVANERYLGFAFPMYWFYDVLRALEYFRSSGGRPDARLQPALDLVRSQRGEDGRWPAGPQRPALRAYVLEAPEGRPSRWNTLRALRVLRWASNGEEPW